MDADALRSVGLLIVSLDSGRVWLCLQGSSSSSGSSRGAARGAASSRWTRRCGRGWSPCPWPTAATPLPRCCLLAQLLHKNWYLVHLTPCTLRRSRLSANDAKLMCRCMRFWQAGVAFADLPGLGDAELQALGVRALGRRRRIITAAAGLRTACPSAQHNPVAGGPRPVGTPPISVNCCQMQRILLPARRRLLDDSMRCSSRGLVGAQASQWQQQRLRQRQQQQQQQQRRQQQRLAARESGAATWGRSASRTSSRPPAAGRRPSPSSSPSRSAACL